MPDSNGALLNTIQSQVHQEFPTDLDILPLFVKAGELIPAWWSKARDFELARFWPRIDHVSSALSMFTSKTASIPVKIVPRDMSIKAHIKQADYYNSILLDGADFGKGWHASLGPKVVMSYSTQDNGAFIECIGDAPMTTDKITGYRHKDYSRPIVGPVLGFAHLDSLRCQRTSNPEFPVIYWDIDGNRYKLHHSRVIFASSLPSGMARMNGVGFSALTRMINTAQHLWDISTAEQEELGSRPKRRIIIGKKGITATEIANSFQQADMVMDSQGLRRYSKSIIIGAKDVKPTDANAIELEIQDLHSALLGEDKERSITLGMFLIALALNIPPRWLWPATSTGATKADAMFQHIAGMGGGIGHLLSVFKQMLGGDTLSTAFGKPIPSHLEVVFDYQDDEQDRQQAEIREIRSKVYEKNLASKIWDIRTARLHALDVGDITEQEFEDMELLDGRLPDGQDVLNLFLTTEPDLQAMLAISVGDVLNVSENDAEDVLAAITDKELEVRAILQNPTRPREFDVARWAYAALQALRRLYEDKQAKEEMEAQLEQGIEQKVPDAVAEEGKLEEAKVEENPPAPPIQKESNGLVNQALQLLWATRKDKPPVVNNYFTLPEHTTHITMPEHTTNVTVPEQAPPEITVVNNLPESRPPHVENKFFMPKQSTAVEKQAPQVIELKPQINNHIQMPEQAPLPAPVFEFKPEFKPEINVTMPEIEEEVTQFERDENSLVKLAKKLRIYKK